MIADRPTRAEISLSALQHNFGVAKELAGDAKLMAVVKAEAYGHGLIAMSEQFARLGADYLGVSFLEEGVQLREAGIDLPILVFGGLVDEQIDRYLEYNLDITVSSVWKARQVNTAAGRKGVKAAVHLKIDTGMGRIGQNWRTADLLFKEVEASSKINVIGLYTHFASAESADLSHALTQNLRFQTLIDRALKFGLEPELIHAANSGALIQLTEEARYTMVRPGIMLYGYAPDPHLAVKIDLVPVMSLKTRIVFAKKPPKGEKIGYSSTWETPGDCWIATLPIGYGDGYPRALGNQWQVWMKGRTCPIVGRISMDMMTINAGNNAYLGDEVLLFGKSDEVIAPLWDLCLKLNTIPYEILCNLTARVPRVILKDS